MNDAFPAFFNCHIDDETESDSRGFRLWLDAMGIRYKSLHVGGDGAVFLNLSGTTISDLSPLTAFSLTHLCLQGCYEIADFSPLKDMNLIWLNLCRTKITDLSPLGKLPLSHLDLHRTRTTDLLPLKDVPLRSLDIRFTRITDLSPLRRMPLREFLLPEPHCLRARLASWDWVSDDDQPQTCRGVLEAARRLVPLTIRTITTNPHHAWNSG